MIYPKEKTREISFPLGGIGAGCIGLDGTGRLVDWEIFNRPNKGSFNGFSHFAVRAEKDGKVLDWRVLNGDFAAPYTGSFLPIKNNYQGFGWGPFGEKMCGYPHFREHEFRGEYPVAEIAFGGEAAFPGNARLTGWSPLIPGNDKDSSLPAAFIEIELENNTADALDYTVVSVMTNPWDDPRHTNRVTGNQLILDSGMDADDFDYGMIALTLIGDSATRASVTEISSQEYWYRGGWCDNQETYWHDMMRGGKFRPRTYAVLPDDPHRTDHGLLAAHFTLAPNERRRVAFVITWHVPNRRNDWNVDDELFRKNGVENRWKNYYATVWRDAADSGAYAVAEYARLRADTFRFRDTLFASTLPEAVLDGVSANVSILKSPTCLRLEDGTFYGWEGVGREWGSCEGSCAHVWNYQQTLPFLFPALERSMRESHLRYSIDENGGAHFRIRLPLGVKADTGFFRPCVDGQYGDLMKFYRDWKISGDDAWLAHWWPTLRRMTEYAWSDDNYDRWDPAQSGIMTGRQHHTLDMELFGENAWLSGHYLGGLKAAAEMARAVGDDDFAGRCHDIFARGKKRLNAELFNGEYYYQKIDLADETVFAQYPDAKPAYWNDEAQEIKYQVGEGLGIDVTIAQLYADIYGLGEIFDAAQNRKTLAAILRHNFAEMRDVINVWRTYVLNDEAGVQICAWPEGAHRPVIPIPYNTEMMCGMEWAFASHLVAVGLVDEGAAIAAHIRRRYDGKRRNPWNEIECGSNYARSMAAYGLLNTYAGFAFDLTRGMIGFAPKITDAPFRCFWSVGTAWGLFARDADSATLTVTHGQLELREFTLFGKPLAITPQTLRAGDALNTAISS